MVLPRACLAAAVGAAVLALATPALTAETGSDSGSIEGRVVDEAGNPLAGVNVTATQLPGKEYSTRTDAAGRFSLAGLPPGAYHVRARVVGFGVELKPVAVAAGVPVELEVALHVLSIEELMQISVRSASKLEERSREAPSVVGVVTREQIQDYGWVSLNDILNKQPGFGPAQDYDRRTVGFRGQFEGWNNNHLLHLVDGIPFNDDLYGTAYTWEVTPLTMVKNVEVLRGPGSALYGSYAANGVVQVNTISASDLDGGGVGHVRVGSAGTRVYDWLQGLGAGKRISAVVSYSGYETDGNEYLSFDGSGRTDAAANLRSFLTNDRRDSRYFWAKLEGGQGLAGLSLQYHDQHWAYQTGHGWLWWIPDFRESMQEGRRILALSYRPKKSGRSSQEYLLRYQRHDLSWNTRYYPNGAFGSYYPAGMWEYLDTGASDVLGRAQFGWDLGARTHLLVGVEADRFAYAGDREHDSNLNVDNAAGGFPPFPDNAMQRLGPWLDYVLDAPIVNLAAYAQLSTRGALGGKANLTLGARYDRAAFDYHDIADPARPTRHRSFERFSPRVGVVLFPDDTVSLKLLAARAFRAPAPTELAGAHTFSLASNIAQLEPEVISTAEAAADWHASRYLAVRGNVFWTKFENQIAYSAANFNLSTNIYTLKTAGAELELLLTHGGLSGFLNYSYARRLDETIIDSTIAANPDRLTWEPAHKANFGATWARKAWTAAFSGHVQGSVARRATDVGTQVLPLNTVSLDVDRYRPRTLGAWVTVDGRVGYRLPKNLTLAVSGTNLLDTDKNRLVKVLAFPFDYRQESRRLYGSLTLEY